VTFFDFAPYKKSRLLIYGWVSC